ncbi:hypothetical protein B5S30_g3658 [[Candida] boidinii]|nr:hypothetical protein B5S30_g3658 [[Candida] boidinii]GMG08267.1 unnamed protein product [[Candida] boidinii]
MSELIDTFLEITSTTDKDIASNFLEMSGNNLDTAVALYFEHGATTTSNNNNISNNDSGHASSSNITSSNSTNRNTPAPAEDDEAFAQRLQNEMYQHDGGNHNNNSNSNNDNNDNEEPPRPVEPIHDQLLPSYLDHNQLHSDHFGFGNFRNSANASSLIFGSDPSGIFNQTDHNDGRRRAGGVHNDEYYDDEDDDNYDNDDDYHDHYNQARYDGTNGVVFGSDDDDDSSNHDVSVEFRRPMNRRARRISNRDDGLTATQRRLAEMFKPPFDIITKTDLETAKNLARSSQKWILINIQLMSDFRCQVLNRDFWSNMEIKDLVRENFIFLQYHSSSSSGEIYKNLYPFTDFPHIAILDPMTGERLKMWSEVPKADKFIEQVVEFLDKFGLDKNHKNPIVEHKTKLDPSSLSEEQQINMAIKKSLNHDEDNDDVVVLENNSENNPIFIDSDDNASVESVEFESDNDEEDEENRDHQMLSRLPSKMDLGEDLSNDKTAGIKSATTTTETTETSTTSVGTDGKFDTANATYSEILATILPKDHEDAPNDPKLTTRIQIRSGDGKRIVKRFNLTDPVAKLYEVVKFNFPITKEHDFRLTAQRDDLFNHFDEDIETAGLKNASVLLDIEED